MKNWINWASRALGWRGWLLLIASSCGGGDAPNPAAPVVTPSCTTDQDCEEGRCDPLRGCVACLFDQDCPEGHECFERECSALVECDTSTDCEETSSSVCDDASKTCVACANDSDCSGTAHCVENHCEPYAACETSADCAEAVCDITLGECVECVSGDDCGSGRTCVAARCETACQDEGDCSEDAPFCGAQGFCVECATHAHCPDVYHCSGGSCELDVCEGTVPRCDASGRGIETCAATGAGYTARPCDPAQSCTADSGAPECVDWTCEPESETCSRDLHSVEVCSADGLSVAQVIECSSDEVCVGGACTPRACEPDVFSCEGDDLYRCSDDGTENELVRTCRNDELCDESEQTCVAIICEPGEPTCDGETATTCNRAGTGFTGDATPCSRSEACFEGDCLPRICLAEYECDGDESLQCLDNGTRLARAEHCDPIGSNPSYCNPDSGRCEIVGCDPSQPLCSGELATVCADDGSGPVAGGVDCTLLDKACFGGSCEPVLCTEEFVCQAGDLYRCEDNGTALSLQGECGRPELCDDVAGVCLPEVCTPGLPVCNASTATTCDATGTGYEPGGIDCAALNQGCLAGSCLPLVCVPDQHLCSSGDVHLCGGSGTQSTLADDCDSSEHCVAGEAACVPNSCSPNAPVCADTIATTCRADGSGPEPGGTDCAQSGKTCRLGVCETLVCTPNERFCQNGHVRLCNATGTASGPYDTCLVTEYCDVTGVARCRPDRCTANGPACSDESLATCNSDGSGYASLSTDCALSGNVCTLTAGCASTATDTLGGTDLSSQNPFSTLYLTALEATPRTIVRLEAFFAVPTDTEVVWLVYDSTVSAGFYTKRFELMTTAFAVPATYHSSGSISVPLLAGYYYAIGALVRGAHTEYQGSSPAAPASFAAIVGLTRSTTDTVPGEVWIDGVVGNGVGIRVVTE